MQHQIWLLTLGGRLFSAPLKIPEENGQNETIYVLDIGTGSGSWAVDIASVYPSVHVTAIDLTPPKFISEVQPHNITYVTANAEGEWAFAGDQKYHYIHGRMLASGIHDWPALLAKCWQYLLPGGYVELIDLEHPFRSAVMQESRCTEPPFIRFGFTAEKAWASNGLDYRATLKHKTRLSEIGFQEITEERLKWCLGSWNGSEDEKASQMVLQNFLQFLSSYGKAILLSGKPSAGYCPLTQKEAEVLVIDATDDLKRNWDDRCYWICM